MPRTREPVLRSPISADHADKLRKLRPCTFYPGSWDKRFVRQMADALSVAENRVEVFEISAAQAENIDRLAHKYRRQIAAMR